MSKKYSLKQYSLNIVGNYYYNKQVSLQIIPSDIDQFFNLESIVFNNNSIRKIPEELTNITTLTILCLSFNEIMTVPNTINKLINLRELFLGSNYITKIPKVLYEITTLNSISFDNCKINVFPLGISKLENLKMIDIGMMDKIPHNILIELNCIKNDLHIYYGRYTKCTKFKCRE